jgi:integrase
MSDLFEKGDTNAIVRGTVMVLKAALNQAVTWNLLSISPGTRVKSPKKKQREVKIWTPQETLKFLEAAKCHYLHARLYPLFHLALSTGMRRGEILALSWSDIIGDRLTIRQNLISIDNEIEISEPKTQSSHRTIILSPETIEVLNTHQTLQRQMLGNVTTVFTSLEGGFLKPRALIHAFHKAIKDAGIPRIRFHDLRHAHASLLIRNKVNPLAVAQRLDMLTPLSPYVFTATYTKNRNEKQPYRLQPCSIKWPLSHSYPLKKGRQKFKTVSIYVD